MLDADAGKLQKPLPVTSMLRARVADGGLDAPLHRILAFLVGSAVSVEEHQAIYAVLPSWFGNFGRDLAVELDADYAGLCRDLGLSDENGKSSDERSGW